jgi:hypothetical protein
MLIAMTTIVVLSPSQGSMPVPTGCRSQMLSSVGPGCLQRRVAVSLSNNNTGLRI